MISVVAVSPTLSNRVTQTFLEAAAVVQSGCLVARLNVELTACNVGASCEPGVGKTSRAEN